MSGDGVVRIDPEDYGQVRRLADALIAAICCTGDDEADAARNRDLRAHVADALHAMLEPPKPPKPEEPLGLGAVVVDVNDNVWVNTSTVVANSWTLAATADRSSYADIDAVEVLSQGVAL